MDPTGKAGYSAHPWVRTATGRPAVAGLDEDENQQPLAEVRGEGTDAMKDCQTHGTIFIYRKDDCDSGSGSGSSGRGDGASRGRTDSSRRDSPSRGRSDPEYLRKINKMRFEEGSDEENDFAKSYATEREKTTKSDAASKMQRMFRGNRDRLAFPIAKKINDLNERNEIKKLRRSQGESALKGKIDKERNEDKKVALEDQFFTMKQTHAREIRNEKREMEKLQKELNMINGGSYKRLKQSRLK
jgi:hypothetical protein